MERYQASETVFDFGVCAYEQFALFCPRIENKDILIRIKKCIVILIQFKVEEMPETTGEEVIAAILGLCSAFQWEVQRQRSNLAFIRTET